MLGDHGDDLHGVTLEVRAAAAPAGRFAGVVEFDQPLRIGRDVVVSPEPVRVVPVATLADRLTGEGLSEEALVVPGAAAGTAELKAADLAALGLAAGRDALFTYHGRNVTLRLVAGTDPVFGLATLRLADMDAMRLGLDLGRRMAGYDMPVHECVDDWTAEYSSGCTVMPAPGAADTVGREEIDPRGRA
ncbi:MAG: hypothetical protein HYU66_22430, partial [Armatimonadetes bacterium]|nr:hypothetical protein [Armatimonadota bacterium]